VRRLNVTPVCQYRQPEVSARQPTSPHVRRKVVRACREMVRKKAGMPHVTEWPPAEGVEMSPVL